MIAVSWEMTDKIGWLWLDNPNRHNALNQRSWDAITNCLTELVNVGARVVIVTGRGGSFCAGADISEFDVVRGDAQSAVIYEKANADAFSAISNLSVPTIAAIDGYCLGGGFGIAAACDIRICSKISTFAVPAAKLGLAYPVEAMGDIVAAIGEQNTKRLLFTADRFDAQTMQKMGFISEICGDVLMSSKKIASKISQLAPLTHHASKLAIRAVACSERSRAEQAGNLTFTSQDYAEGRVAFREKRAPKFEGR